jgi:hypothetical protein
MWGATAPLSHRSVASGAAAAKIAAINERVGMLPRLPLPFLF